MATKKKNKRDLLWYVCLEVCEPQGDLREITLDELDVASQERVMASIREEVAQSSIGGRLDGISVNNVTLAKK